MKSFIKILIILCFFGCEKEVEYVQKPQRPIPNGYNSPKEALMIDITNDYRAASGLPLYKTSLHLYYLAKDRVNQNAEADTLSHAGFYQAYQQSEALFYGESISYNYTTAESNIAAFRASENHWSMFISPVYEYIAIACEERYTVVLVARWRPYRADGKRELEIKPVRTGNIITTEVKS